MFHRRAVLGGLLGGVLGAALWALIALVTSYEIGWIAWAVGGLVGYGVALGNRGAPHSPVASGVLAAAITLLAIPAGKYALVELSVPSDAELVSILMENTRNDEFVISYVADDVVDELEASGETVDWPPGVDPAVASTREEYPPDVWTEAEARWASMSEGEREDFRGVVEEITRENVAASLPEIRATIRDGAFLRSFAPMDLLFFGLAVVTAYGVAAGGRKTGEEVAEEFREAVKLALVEVMVADAHADAREVRAVRDVYAKVAGGELAEEEVRREIALAESGRKDITAVLSELAPHLNEHGKETVIRAAFMVAAADGELGDREKELISGIATALGVTHDRLPRILGGLMEELRGPEEIPAPEEPRGRTAAGP